MKILHIKFLLHVCDVSFQQTLLTKRGHILPNRHCFFPHCIELNPLTCILHWVCFKHVKIKKIKKVCLIPWHNHVHDYDVFRIPPFQSIWTRLLWTLGLYYHNSNFESYSWEYVTTHKYRYREKDYALSPSIVCLYQKHERYLFPYLYIILFGQGKTMNLQLGPYKLLAILFIFIHG